MDTEQMPFSPHLVLGNQIVYGQPVLLAEDTDEVLPVHNLGQASWISSLPLPVTVLLGSVLTLCVVFISGKLIHFSKYSDML